jgi:methionine sulfoxide reductase catalytic subunit
VRSGTADATDRSGCSTHALRDEVQLGFTDRSIEFVADFAKVGGGYGGYNQHHEFFGYRQSL